MSIDTNYYPAPGNAINGLTAAATPPTYNSGNGWYPIPKSWAAGAVEEIDIHVYADGSNAVTAARLVGGRLEYQVLADDNIESIGSNELTLTSHVFETGDGPVRVSNSGGALPTGISASVDYWVVKTGANTLKLSDSLYNALNSKTIVVSGGSGTNTISDVVTGQDWQKTKRIHWASMGYLGEANDGAMTLTSVMSWQGRVKHADEIVVYSMVATFGSAVATYCRLVPRPVVRGK